MTIARTICLGFLLVIFVGAVLLTLPISSGAGTWNNFLVALFTSTSAVCVTGLGVVDTGTYFSFWGQLILVGLIQVGGFGYMMMTTFLMLLLGRKFDLRQKLAIQESFDRPFLQGSSNLVRSVIATTLIFEITAIFFMLFVFAADYGLTQGLWLSIFHSVSAWNNAGFSLFKDNLIGYQSSWIINIAITALIIFGGLGYQVIIELYLFLLNVKARNKKRFCFSLNFKVVTKTTIFLLLFGFLSILFTEVNNPDTVANVDVQTKVLAAWFQSVTTRTAGFNTIDISKLSTGALFITMGLMFIGASPSGTGGGIKTTTLRILAYTTRSVLRGQEEVIMYQRKIPTPLILKTIAVVFGSTMTIIIATFIIAILETDFTTVQVLFEVISAFATVGLSLGITSGLSPLSQIILIVTMYIGRVGVILLMAALVGDPRPTMIQYPEENLLVG